MKKILATTLLLFALLSCSDDSQEQEENNVIYGTEGTHQVNTYTTNDYLYSTMYFPSDIETMATKVPLLFFISGWYSTPAEAITYDSLLRFIASQGYAVLYTNEGAVTDHTFCLNKFDAFLESNDATIQNILLPNLDTTKIGVLGSSAGGGMVFSALKHYSDMGYGANGRFLMALDTWFAFGMDEADMQALPSNTNAIILQFGQRGNSHNNGTDARIPLTEYSLLTSINASKKDYQVYSGENSDHSYPKGTRPFSEMQGILKPLHALLDYTFITQSDNVRKIALEVGNDNPYDNGNGIQEVLPNYNYPCDGSDTLIDYCSIIP